MISEIIDEAKNKMKATLKVFEDDLTGIRGNRASTALVDRLIVEYYGQDAELRQLANLSTPEATQILIIPFDSGSLKAIEKAIQASDLGVNPNVDGQRIWLNMPALTQERRRDLAKVLSKRTEDAKISIRNIRRSANQDLNEFEKEKLISEDDQKRGEQEIQKLTDDYIEKLEAIGKAKEKDILEI